MVIDLSKINKEELIGCLSEENDRDNFTRTTLERQVKNHQTYGKQEEFEKALQRYKNKKDYFFSLISIIPDNDEIEERDEEYIQFWKDLIEHQIYISNERIKDWSEGGEMYRPEICKNLETFKEACQNIINIDLGKIKCMEVISSMINQ